jgi:hypothetical protein
VDRMIGGAARCGNGGNRQQGNGRWCVFQKYWVGQQSARLNQFGI